MVRIGLFGRALFNLAVIFSFIFNVIFLAVLIGVVVLIFNIKNGVVQPLVNNLYGSFIGLDQASILTTIHVNDVVPVKLDIPLSTQTKVVLTDNVPIQASASFALPGGGGIINGSVSIVLPKGLVLPIALDLHVPVNDKLPISLTVPVNIPLNNTQLHDPFFQLQDTLRPYVRLLGNLPSNWSSVPPFVGQVLSDNPPNLLAPNPAVDNPWRGFRTGLGTPVPTSPGSTPIGSLTTPTTINPVNPISPTPTLPPTMTPTIAPAG